MPSNTFRLRNVTGSGFDPAKRGDVLPVHLTPLRLQPFPNLLHALRKAALAVLIRRGIRLL